MRLAIVNWSRRELGGAERYLGSILPGLRRAGHEVALLCEVDEPSDRERIPLPPGTPVWCAAEAGREGALAALREWGPDLVYTQIVLAPELEAAVHQIAPAVLFAHGYFGTCISGAKTLKHPEVRPCDRRFGWKCLLHYYPDRCGGLSPATMLKDFRRQSKRRELLAGYRAVVTNSAHMRSEYVKHGCDPARVHAIPLPVSSGDAPLPGASAREAASAGGGRTLLFLGRMDRLKGGLAFLEALPRVRSALDAPLRVVFAGDGPDRSAWERRAREIERGADGLTVEFTGWVRDGRLDEIWAGTHLLVVPSLWPEPFGMVGPEAGMRGVPAVAFAVGGIPDWLHDGVNGHLAPADPPTSGGLAEAIVRALRDPVRYAALREGAVRVARRFDPNEHLQALLGVFEAALEHKGTPHAR